MCAKKGKSSLNTRRNVQFLSPGKQQKCKKTVIDFDDFNKDILWYTIFNMCAAREFPTAEKLVVKINGAVGVKGNAGSMLRILKSTGFKYVRCNNGIKFFMECSDITTTKAIFLWIMHNTEQAGHANKYILPGQDMG
jgi:hypothetical protein